MIYFIQSGEFVKIGHCARDPIRRLEKLQIGNPITLKIVALMEGGHKDEQHLHLRFHKLRVRGEWFKLEAPIRALIKPFRVDHDHVSRNRPDRMIYGFPAHLLPELIMRIAANEPGA